MKTLLFLIFFLLISSINSHAERINIVTLYWSPYAGENLKDNGFHAVIIKEAFKKVKIKINLKFYPWKRAYNTALLGKAFLMSASDTKGRRKIFYYSNAYDNAASYLIGLKEKNYKYNGKIESLQYKKIGVLRGHYLVNFFKNSGITKVEKVNSDVENIKLLFSERIDFIAMSKLPALYIIKNNLEIQKYGDLKEVVFYNPPLRSNPVHLIGKKDMPKSKETILLFNQGLRKIKSDGTFNKIMKRFGVK